jgi:peptide/nickel transport system substrate-binding protein
MRFPLLRWLPALCTLSLAACAAGERPAASDETGGTMIVTVPAEPSTLFPPLLSGTQGVPIVGVLFDRLADIGDGLESYGDRGFQPRLATSWRWSSDSLSIAFALDSLARWHDGQPVTAEDVRYTFRVYTRST